jgi:hypothetical protein
MARRGKDDDLVFVLRQTCGEVWLRIASQNGAKILTCEGADAEGRLTVGIARDHREVECRVRQRISTATR